MKRKRPAVKKKSTKPDIHATDNCTKPDYSPGSWGCHEALHMASFLTSAVSDELCEHPAVKANPEWAKLANKACDSLMTLYQKIGAKHL